MNLETSKGVNRIGHTALRVKDLERSKSFYIKLGMKLIWDDKDWCYLEAGILKDGLALLGPGYKAAGPHLAFHFEDKKEVMQIHNDLKGSGIKVGSIHDHRDGTASFYMQDTEGNWLEMLYVPPGGIQSNI
ncbi:MAG: lactoylglutathione lyase [Prochlorococcus sp. SP3034]|nr:lactoylglutathione lyase [Prochlorococcus sp. SP3034]